MSDEDIRARLAQVEERLDNLTQAFSDLLEIVSETAPENNLERAHQEFVQRTSGRRRH